MELMCCGSAGVPRAPSFRYLAVRLAVRPMGIPPSKAEVS